MRVKIGDRVLVHGHVDEIRKDTVIIRNDGGYFGTVLNEILVADNFALGILKNLELKNSQSMSLLRWKSKEKE